MSELVLGEPPSWWTSDHWATPPSLIEDLEREFGPFDLDPCCMPVTAKAPKFYTAQENGLAQPWHGKVFMNPPYSNPAPWVEKALSETRSGNAHLVVALLPVATDTKWFHDFINGKAEIRFLQGRVRFFGWAGTPITAPKSPSMIVIFSPPAALSAVAPQEPTTIDGVVKRLEELRLEREHLLSMLFERNGATRG